MKKALLIILIALIGVGILVYPTVADHLAAVNGSKAVATYAQTITAADQATLDQLWNSAIEYNQTLSGEPAHDPFIAGTGMAMPADYLQQLSLAGDGSDSMGTIEIPKISVDLPIYHGTDPSTLDKGIGHLQGSSLPVGGAGTHCVLTGHTGLTSAKMFTDLTELQKGDYFFLHVLGHTLAYQVDQIEIVQPDNLTDLARVEGMDYCTLVTCYPYGVNTQRLFVRGVRVDYTPQVQTAATTQAATKTGLTQAQKTLYLAAGITIAVMLLLIIGAIILRVRRSKKEKAAALAAPAGAAALGGPPGESFQEAAPPPIPDAEGPPPEIAAIIAEVNSPSFLSPEDLFGDMM